MLLKCLTGFFCWIVPVLLFSQDFKTFQGLIIDSDSKDSIPFVNVIYGEQGVFSNIDGRFKLTVSSEEQSAKDSIQISHVGYQTYWVIWDSIDFENVYPIVMTPAIQDLDEIVVKGKKIKVDVDEIVRNAITNLPDRVETEPYVLESFLKETHYFEYLLKNQFRYLKYQESALMLEQNEKQHFNVVVKEVRQSDDFREVSGLTNYKREHEEDHKQIANEVLRLDYQWPYEFPETVYKTNEDLLDPILGNLNNDFISRHKFKLDRITRYDGRVVYVIKVLPTRKSIDIGSFIFIPIGLLYITGDNHSILEYQYSYIINPRKRNGFDARLFTIVGQGSVLFRDIVRYNELDGQLYLNYIMRDRGDGSFMAGWEGLRRNNLNEDSGHFRVRYELTVNNIIHQDQYVDSLLTPNYTSIFPENHQYNSDFWNQSNVLLNSEEDKKLLKDLGEGLSIEAQFIKNAGDSSN